MQNTKIVKAHLVKDDGTLSVVIPKEIRESLRITAGDYLVVSRDKRNRVIFRKIQPL